MKASFSSFEELEGYFSSIASPGIRPGLERIEMLLESLGRPQDRFPAVHIVGTNGKGSTAAFTESILRSSGYRTALYTSPHLESPAERLQIAGKTLSLKDWSRAALTAGEALSSTPPLRENPPTFFEIVTAAAFLLCEEKGIDIAVVEAGLGGRLDATNLLGRVVLTLIASISIDHSEFLGNSIESIAAEKFAVMRPSVPAWFSGSPPELIPLFLETAEKIGALPHVAPLENTPSGVSLSEEGVRFALTLFGREVPFSPSLAGAYQVENALLAISGALSLKSSFPGITLGSIQEGIARARWPGRFEILRKDPPLILDGGHNPEGIRRLVETVRTLYGDRKLAIVFAAMKDKEYSQSLSLLQCIGSALHCTAVPGHDRAAPPSLLAEAARTAGWPEKQIREFGDPFAALEAAEQTGEGVLCCGSLYLVGFLRERLRRERGEFL
ncbi:MAG: folylpolyglutamate synthase/dihydrofolate synthase family protein [Synergistaceae bacterium]|nr:folylpolyglutamate synthase/dihydrofolate synthase family protein [Synergistaceae bacterium]